MQKADFLATWLILHLIENKIVMFSLWGRLAQWLASRTTDQGVPGSRPGLVAVRCGLGHVTFTPCSVVSCQIKMRRVAHRVTIAHLRGSEISHKTILIVFK